jgi:hypothetical protein
MGRGCKFRAEIDDLVQMSSELISPHTYRSFRCQMRNFMGIATIIIVAIVILALILFVLLAPRPTPISTPGTGPPPVKPVYFLEFNQVGLPAGVPWGVTLNGSEQLANASAVVLEIPNGTYYYEINAPGGYSASPTAGTLAITGAATSTEVRFSQRALPVFTTQFNISVGQAAGVSLEVYVNLTGGFQFSSVNGSDISLALPNGTYQFTVATDLKHWFPTPYGGTIDLAGHSLWRSISINPYYYQQGFLIEGLPATDNFSVIIVTPGGGFGEATGMGSEEFNNSAWNGTYTFSVVPVPGYRASPSQGSVVMDGANTTTVIQYTTESTRLSNVTFVETGLVLGVNWSVTILGTTEWSDGTNSVAFVDPNGSYSFVVRSLVGFSASPSSGTISIMGQNLVKNIDFAAS